MIAYLHPTAAFGAVEQYVIDLVEGARATGEEIALVYPDVPELEPFERLGGANVRLVALPPRVFSSAPLLALRLARLLLPLRPRLVHVTEVWPSAQIGARLAGVRRVLVTHHTPELPRADNAFGRLWLRLGWWMRPEVIYTSESDRAFDGPRPRSHVVPLGIDLDRFAARGTAPGNGPVIGNVARLSAQKGQRVLLEAAPLVLERYPGARFVVAGEGELRAELQTAAERLGVADRVELLGARRDVPELLSSFDVFVMPSYFEGLCLAAIEAQAAGVPVVATDVGGLAETVVPGETGTRCRVGDPASLAQGILWVLDHPEEAQRLAAEAKRRARERYSKQRMVEETLALYR